MTIYSPDVGHFHDVLAPSEYRWGGQQEGVGPYEQDGQVRVVVVCLARGQRTTDEAEALVGEDGQCRYRSDPYNYMEDNRRLVNHP